LINKSQEKYGKLKLILIENILNDQIKKYVETMIDLKKLN
jgi:hypothetical protein